MKLELEDSDLAEIREMLMGNVDFEPTDAEIREVVLADPYAMVTARDWGWNDTEVRDRICVALERRRGLR